MGIDWGLALQVGGIGFGMVFVLLVILALVVQLTGLATTKASGNKNKTNASHFCNQCSLFTISFFSFPR